MVVAIGQRSVSAPQLAVGASLFACAASTSIHEAACHAVRELQMLAEYAASAGSKAVSSPNEALDFADLWGPHDDLAKIIRLYLDPRMKPALDFFMQGPPLRRRWRESDDAPDALVMRLRREGLRPLAVDMSLARVPGMTTFQAIICGTQPLAFGVGAQRLGTGLLPALPPPRNPPLPSAGHRPNRRAVNPYPMPLA